MKINRKLFYILVTILTVMIVFWLFLRFSPYPQLRQFLSRPYSVRYYDRYGMLLQITPLADGLRRERHDEIPQYIKDVFVFAEDGRFYQHFGVDVFSVIRAFSQNASKKRRVSGASTITMQLARLISDNAREGKQNNPPKLQSMGQKIGEAFNAIRLETRLSKNDILELYINSLPFGFSTEGVTSAARTFFASELSMLSPAQLFCLAVIPRRPNLYNPLDNPTACKAAAVLLHERFSHNKKLSRKWPLLANTDERDFQYAVSSARRFQYPFELPHFIRFINTQTGEKVSSGRGLSANQACEIFLSIDLALQKHIQNSISGNVAMYYSSRLTNGSAIVIDNDTGEILAWVGSADFFNTDAAGQIDGVLALNQPGSSMKPFLYAMALEKGFNPSDVIADIPMTFGESEIYIPQNFNNRFNGPMLFRSALASSLNIPAVYLLYRLSVRNYTEQLLKLKFNSIEQSAESAGLGLALGNAPVSLLELVRAFSVFPREGYYLPLTWQITGNSKQLTENKEQIFSADTARLICSFLSDSSARVLAFGAGRNFRTSFPAIFKTGTANQYQSIVALGATMKYSAGVWMGNFTGETVLDKTGSSIPASIVRDTLNAIHNANPNSIRNFPEPEKWKVRRICALSGMEPTQACLSVINEFVNPEQERKICTWHYLVNGRSETVYPAEYQSWFNSSVRQGSVDYASRSLEIINPRKGFVYLSNYNNSTEEIPVEVIGGEENILRVTHNERYFNINRPFVFFLPRIKGLNNLHVQNGNEEEAITFTIE